MSEENNGQQNSSRQEKNNGMSPETAAERERATDAPSDGNIIRDFFSTHEIFERVLATADDELSKAPSLLFWSGLAAGLSLGLTFIARVLFTEMTPGDSSGLVGNLFYPIGFVLIVLGRYQLFTENTLTPVALVLTRLASLRELSRLWGIVFVANMIGALAISLLLATTSVFDESTRSVAFTMGEETLKASWGAAFWKAVIAGWLVASMVWLIHSSRDTISRLFIVWIVMYFIGATHFYHIITSSVEVFYLAFTAHAELSFLWTFTLPVLLGNTLGGVFFVAVLNYAQVSDAPFQELGSRLSWKEWFFGYSDFSKSLRFKREE